jgi:Mg2+-importing ATPase
MSRQPGPFWNLTTDELLRQLQSAKEGLSGDEARERLSRYGSNLLKPRKRSDSFTLLLAQFKSPLALILFFATGLSFFLGNAADAFIILAIVLASGLLGFWQERGASNAVEKLLSIVRIKADVFRDGRAQEVPVEEIVPGDIVILGAGDIIPGDCLVLESKDLFVDEAIMTGETFPVEKAVEVLPAETPLGKRANSLWMGTHVVTGSGKALVVSAGTNTECGKLSEKLRLRPEETDFERGIRQFGYFLMEVTLVLVVAIFAINVYLARPVLDSFLFSLALAVGLTPQLLPAIISINLAHGAKRMAQEKVIVKRLASIENFGSMNVICSDKTGTLTEGVVHLQSAVDAEGAPNEKALLYAYLNAFYETGFANPIDQAIRSYRQFDLTGYQKTDEIPYDFLRKRLSILVSRSDTNLLITKGALRNVLDVCSGAETRTGAVVDIGEMRESIQRNFETFSTQGCRTLGIAYKDLGTRSSAHKDDETGMTFLGFLVLFDPPKARVIDTVRELKSLGVSLKVITGDNNLVAANFSRQMGLSETKILTGPDLGKMSDNALLQRVADVEVFAEVEPNQKERIILALQKAGNVVGYVGDGINDASALHAADVGISVESAVDVAKEAADIILLEQDLGILVRGVREGRVTFANTLKYVFMATSANFGNMFSMAGVSLFIPFLPLLPKQILLTNLLTDFPEMTIATDNVDNEMVDYPRRWDIKVIRKFMMTFGLLSSLFDYVTFGALLLVFHANQGQFRTGWFVESVCSASLVVLVIRSRKSFLRSRPSKYLLIATLLTVVLSVILPFTLLGSILGFSPLPASFLLLLATIVTAYIISSEMVKTAFYKRVKS